MSFFIEELEIPKKKVIEIKNRLLKKANTLSKQSHRGQKEPCLMSLNQGHRRLVEGEFKIIYLIESDIVYVTDFFYTHRDLKKMKGYSKM